MVVIEMISWWYALGWKNFAGKLIGKLRDTADFFSIGLLIKTLFAPYRQIAVGEGGSWARAIVDNLVSRAVGGFVRIMLVIIGTIILIAQGIATAIALAFWPIMPVFPIFCIIFMMMGVAL